ncbi:MAG TPA: SpoIIE family protein phosphatase [Spirochaetota bacterium]|mgnify:FL=1|nr:SpoIIE family protein phosphatase [Spirochaetota bacterium]HOM38864.1 SpoIIE family protein phosphatase [Spirochaetota bacterium]
MKDISKNNFIKIKEKIFNNQNTDIIDIILNSTVNGILITDIDGNIKWVNKAFEKNTGYSLQEVIGKNPRILKSGLTKREEYEYMWESILNKGYFEGQIYNINKYGFIYKQSVKIWRIKEYFLAIIDYEKSYEKTEKEIKSQFYLASKIQQKLLPPIPELDNLNITYTYKSLNEVGGDIIEIIKIDKNKTLVFVGDVSGHGIPAAMIQMMLKTLIKEEKNYEDIENYIKIINKKMIELDIEMYLTCFYGIFDTDKMLLEYVLCGHPYPILINDNYVKFIQNQNSQIIGIFEDQK